MSTDAKVNPMTAAQEVIVEMEIRRFAEILLELDKHWSAGVIDMNLVVRIASFHCNATRDVVNVVLDPARKA